MTIEKLNNKFPWNIVAKIETIIAGGDEPEITREPLWETYKKDDGSTDYRPTDRTRIKFRRLGPED